MDIKTVSATTLALLFSTNIMSSTVVINEFFPNAIGTDGGNEWIELYNYYVNTVDISGWQIQKATSTYSSLYTFPEGTQLLPGAFMVLGGSNIENADITMSSLGLGNAGSSGDAIRLLDASTMAVDTVIYGNNNNDGFVDDDGLLTFDLAAKPNEGWSLGRVFDGFDTNNSSNDFIVFENATIGTSNNLTTVPIPSSIWLFISGIIGISGITRRRRAATIES